MNKIMEFIGSDDSYWGVGIKLGIALIIISLLPSIKLPFFEPNWDWWVVFFIGLSIFFFFMGIRLNTEINTIINQDTDNEGKIKKETKTYYQTYLRKFNKLSQTAFTISVIFGIFLLIRLIYLSLSVLLS